MRGRTLNDAVIVLDEAQNTTTHQIKMFLTRLGMNAKMIITGDVTQIDLPRSVRSGLVRALHVLNGVEGIGMVEFGKKDIVRHHLVQRIVEAYQHYDDEMKSQRDTRNSRNSPTDRQQPRIQSQLSHHNSNGTDTYQDRFQFFPAKRALYHGKVRDVYDISDDIMVMVATDRISAFDVILPKGIPFKGQVLNQIWQSSSTPQPT